MSQLEKLEALEHCLSIDVSQEEVTRVYKQHLHEVSGKISMKGFRAGKVPQNVVETRHRSALLQEVTAELIQKALEDAIKEHDLNIAGMPKIDSKGLVKDQPFNFTATFEIYPDIELKDLSDAKIEKQKSEVVDADIDAMIKKISHQQAQWNESDSAATLGDKVTIDFSGSIDGKEFDGGHSENFSIELGSGQMIAGFEAGIVGMTVKQEKDITVTFPEAYAVEDLANKEAVFKIKLHKVESSVLPELNDELAKKLGFEDGLDAMKTKIRENMQAELKSKLKNNFKKRVLDVLVERNPINIPSSLVDVEVKHMQKMMLQQFAAQQGKTELPEIDLPVEPYLEEARKRVTLGLLLSEVIKQHELSIEAESVNARLNDLANSYDDKEQAIAWYRNNKQLMADVEAAALEDQAVDKLLENANIVESSVSYDAIVNEK